MTFGPTRCRVLFIFILFSEHAETLQWFRGRDPLPSHVVQLQRLSFLSYLSGVISPSDPLHIPVIPLRQGARGREQGDNRL